jgi:Novel STAND NTPase 1
MLQFSIDSLQAPKFQWPGSPYKGLNYYTPADAPLFAERDAEIEDCATLLGEFTTRILLLHGRSGTGKSSFLRAGLIPRLQRQLPGYHFIPGPALVLEPTFVRSTDDPILRLSEALIAWLPQSDPELARLPDFEKDRLLARLRGNFADRVELGNVLIQTLKALTAKFTRILVIVIDQSEEVITLGSERDRARARYAFFRFLRDVCIERLGIRIVVALRTEFYGHFCDEFKFDPQPAADRARTGAEQFMLHPFRDPTRIAAAIVRPTLATPVDGYGIPHDIYQFEYEAGLPELIAADLLTHSGVMSTLPVLQLVCQDLYQKVVVQGHRRTIAEKDYGGKGVEGRVDEYIDRAVAEALKNIGRASVTQAELHKWRLVLAELVVRQEGGSVSTVIRPERELCEQAAQFGLGGDIPSALNELTNENWRLLRVVRRAGERAGDVRQYSLGHDALASALVRWREFDGQRAAIEQRAKRRIRFALASLTAVATALLLFVAVIGSEFYSFRGRQTIWNIFAQEQSAPEFRLRTLLLLSSYIKAQSFLGLISSPDDARYKLISQILRSPRYGGRFEAVGVDATGARIARMTSSGAVSVQDLGRGGATSSVGTIPASVPIPGAPWGPAIGFVAGLGQPVVYRNGSLYYWAGSAFKAASVVDDLLPPSFGQANIPPMLEINGGMIRLSLWNQQQRSISYALFQPRSVSGGVKFEQLAGPAVVRLEAVVLPTLSHDSHWFAQVRTIATKTPQIVVGKLSIPTSPAKVDLPDGSAGEAATSSDAGRELIEFPFSVAFTPDNQLLAVRDKEDEVAVIGLQADTPSAPVLFSVPPDMRGFYRAPWLFARPALAAVDTGELYLFAWLDRDAFLRVFAARSGLPSVFSQTDLPLLTDADGATSLRFSADGRFLTLVQFRGTQESRYRVWDLSEDYANEVRRMGPEAMRKQACRIAGLDQSPLFNTLEESIWLDGNSFQPCAGTQ